MHGNMHIIERAPQSDASLSQIFPTNTIRPGDASNTGLGPTSITFDAQTSQSAYTTLLLTVQETIPQPVTTIVQTTVRTSFVTDASEYASLQASESSAKAQETGTAAATSSKASETSQASGASSSNNLSTLIPAIVVPVAVVLLASFVGFWLFMRRRHRRQLKKEPEFVMATKIEKPSISRGNSNSSGHSSTRELVPMSKLEKEVAVTTSEVGKASLDLFPPKYSTSDIGVARPMTPPDKNGAKGTGNERSVPNFSSVRPSTANRSRSGSHASAMSPARGPPPRSAGRHSPPKSSRGPSPAMRGPSPTMRGTGPPPQRPPRADSARRSPDPRHPPRANPSSLQTNMNKGNRAPPPHGLDPPTPTGAFNGASPISQYSPIVKGHPNLGAIAAANSAEKRGNPSPLSTKDLEASTKRDVNSPIDDIVLSHENMRIARLANSSRLGFNDSPVEANFPSRGNNGTRALEPVAERPNTAGASVISPQLPPPLTKQEMPPKPFARGPDSPGGGSSIYPSPSVGMSGSPRIGGGPSIVSLPRSEQQIGVASSTALAHRASIVSRLSSDDEYEDMDAKSDVSSLDDRDKWEMESEQQESRSHVGTGYNGSGYGSAGMSPVEGPAASSSANTAASKPNLRDRDSEGPFVLSRY